MKSIIYIIGLVLAVLAVIDICKKPISVVGKVICSVIVLLTSWIGLIVYYLWAKDHITEWGLTVQLARDFFTKIPRSCFEKQSLYLLIKLFINKLKPVRIIGLSAFAVVIITLLGSCGSRTEEKRLSDIESYIDSRPDSALAAIRAIDTTALRGRAVKAKYSLLHAMALDKNYIDTADTRVVQSAVDWYSRHGSPEEKLKAYYYLGVSHFNGGRYNQAIIAYTRAEEFSEETENKRLLGLLYTGLADTFTKTKEFSRATPYIDKSIDSFASCGATSYVSHQRFRKAQNLVNIKKWDEALSNFEDLLSDQTIHSPLLESIKANYAITLIVSPNSDILKSLRLFDEVVDVAGSLENRNQEGAYAFALKYSGQKEAAEDMFRKLRSESGSEDVYYNYWRHRSLLLDGEYEAAYKYLSSSLLQSDSLAIVSEAISSSKARDEFLSKDNANKALIIENTKGKAFISLLLFFMASIIVCLIIWRILVVNRKEKERMAATINAYEDEVKKLELENKTQKDSIGRLGKKNNKARFAFIYELFMLIKKKGDKSPEIIAKDIIDQVKDLHSNPESQKAFEGMLNKECDGIMKKFRKDFPSLSEDEYNLASYVFAGFDNYFLTILMNSVSHDSMRMAKSRLKKKIATSSSEMKDVYLGYF